MLSSNSQLTTRLITYSLKRFKMSKELWYYYIGHSDSLAFSWQGTLKSKLIAKNRYIKSPVVGVSSNSTTLGLCLEQDAAYMEVRSPSRASICLNAADFRFMHLCALAFHSLHVHPHAHPQLPQFGVHPAHPAMFIYMNPIDRLMCWRRHFPEICNSAKHNSST